ncbi:MAG: YqhA family protein [Kofleriaceae bacterium]
MNDAEIDDEEKDLPGLLRALGAFRWLMGLPVFGCLVIGLALLVHTVVEVGVDIYYVMQKGGTAKAGKALAIAAIEVIDRFLLAAVAFIVALGLCKLFVNRRVPVPAWLEINTLDHLKDKLIRVIIVILGVVFLGQVAAWDGGYEILAVGGAIALVVAALSYFLFAARSGEAGH